MGIGQLLRNPLGSSRRDVTEDEQAKKDQEFPGYDSGSDAPTTEEQSLAPAESDGSDAISQADESNGSDPVSQAEPSDPVSQADGSDAIGQAVESDGSDPVSQAEASDPVSQADAPNQPAELAGNEDGTGVHKPWDESSPASPLSPSSPSTPGSLDPTDLLKKIGELHASGVLTDAEFQGKKGELLARL